ncbi:xylulokinase [Plantactinospora mayteni]|uniref:Xylulose kinase n=1 Tax=Plantactinospora mayteni TaxID=566021 RepID=A0ABQ4EZC1_9ACTN|nr:xylulokinase [Plantactinospora mayteni]GIH00007.1 xylulokinase [Plantactinospora mayteni]
MLIAHDLGTTGDKASLHTDTGALVGAVTVTYPTRYAPGGIAEQDPAHWWTALADATRQLMARHDVHPAEVRGLAISGQMMGAVLLDAAYEPVRPSIIWADTRSGAQCAELVERIGAERAYKLLGHRLNPTYSITKVMWVRDHEPEVFGRVRHVCLAKDYAVYRLTGRLATDPSDASSTNAYDQERGTWSDVVLGAAGLDPALLPEIVPATAVVGTVTSEAAEATGLRVGTPVLMGGGDGPLAAVGAGVVSPADGAYCYLGSSSWVSLAAPRPLHDPAMRTMTFDHVVPGHYVPTATMQAGGASLEWIADVLEPAGDRDRFDRLVEAAETATAAGDGLYFLPHLLGERSPYWDPEAAGAFVGLRRHHDRAHLVRAVLEGVAFNLLTCVDAFREHGLPVDRVDAIGGGAASDAWLRILADVWGATVRRRSIVEEANSLGAAVTAAVGLGLVDDFGAARKLSEVTAEFSPDPARHADYRRRHAIFLDAYRRLEPWNAARGGEPTGSGSTGSGSTGGGSAGGGSAGGGSAGGGSA